MSRNGSGGYSLPSNSWNPALNGVSATAADWQALINDVATAIQQSVSADGQTPITGNLQMGGNKLTGLGAGNGTGQSLRFEQLFSQGAIADIASAATVDIGAQLTTLLRVTGTTGITSFGTNYNGPRFLIFQGIVTLTHSATLVLPGAANITTAANDALIAVPISGGWQVVAYTRAAGIAAVAGPLASSGITGAAASGANVDITSLGNNTSTVYTTAGTSTAYTITPTPAIASYAIGQSFVVNFNAASGASPTLQISGIATPPNLVRSTNGGYVNIAANDIPSGLRSRVTLISTTQAVVENLPSLYLSASIATTSGTSIDVTGISGLARRITINFNAVSTNGVNSPIIQLGSGSVQTSGYVGDSAALQAGASVSAFNFTSGFGVLSGTGTNSISGIVTLTLASGNTWIASGTLRTTSTVNVVTAGIVTLAGAIDRFRLTTLSGADTFDAGSISVIYE